MRPQFGGSEKCVVCTKTVYLAEKIVVEDKEDKKTFHKACLRCSHCKVVLSLGNYASMQGIFYCKPHFKQLFATKGNYDEGFGKDKHSKNWAPQAVSTAPTSFVPVDKEDGKKDATATPSSIASKFGKTSINAEKCHVCHKTVYATEKTVIEDKEDKKVFHKTCLKCAQCNVILSLGNYASMQGVFYCKPHYKQLFATKGNYDEGFGKEKASSKWEPQSVVAPTSFVPVDKDEPKTAKTAAPESVANKFSKGSTSEKCSSCGKTVYLTEKIVVEDKEDKQTFHKSCLRCKHCQVILSLGNYASMQGVFYCKPHFKQLFAAKGNYDEGFGKEKHTKKWADSKEGEAQENAEEVNNHAAELREKEEKGRQEKERGAREERERGEREERERGEREEKEREEREREEREREEEEKERERRRRLREQEEELEREREEEERRAKEEAEERAREEEEQRIREEEEEARRQEEHARLAEQEERVTQPEEVEEEHAHHHTHEDGEEHPHHHTHEEGEEHHHHHTHEEGEEHHHHEESEEPHTHEEEPHTHEEGEEPHTHEEGEEPHTHEEEPHTHEEE